MGHKSCTEQSRDVWEGLANSAVTTDDLAPIPDVIMWYVLIIYGCLIIQRLFWSQTFRNELSRVWDPII